MGATKAGRLSGEYLKATPAVTAPPAEKPMIPTRSGETPNSDACWRTYLTAAKPSSIARGTTPLTVSWNFCRSATAVTNSWVASSPVCARRYFSTNAVTPLLTRYCATSVPSLAIESAMKPPPGQMTTAVPFFNSGEGLKTVRLGLVTLLTTSVFQTFEKYCFSGYVSALEPGGVPG